MKRSRGVIAIAAGGCMSAALGGACAALTSLRPEVLFLSGIVCAIIAALPAAGHARSRTRPRPWLYFLIGVAAGIALPARQPGIAGSVWTHALASQRGDIFAALDTLDRDPEALLHRRITVTGEWASASGDARASVSRRIMTCCAADAVAVGFDVSTARPVSLPDGALVRAQGVVAASLLDGEIRYVLEQCTVSRLEEPRAVMRRGKISQQAGRRGESKRVPVRVMSGDAGVRSGPSPDRSPLEAARVRLLGNGHTRGDHVGLRHDRVAAPASSLM